MKCAKLKQFFKVVKQISQIIFHLVPYEVQSDLNLTNFTAAALKPILGRSWRNNRNESVIGKSFQKSSRPEQRLRQFPVVKTPPHPTLENTQCFTSMNSNILLNSIWL